MMQIKGQFVNAMCCVLLPFRLCVAGGYKSGSERGDSVSEAVAG